MDFDFLVSEFESKSGVKKDDILNLVDKKHSEMGSLITKEGAIYLVAKELGVNLTENSIIRMPIRNISPGMRSVNVIGRIFKISKINEFTKSNGSSGRVANVFIGDNTGFLRIPLWDDQVKLLEETTVSIGDIVQVNNGFARENTFGEVEISLGKFGAIGPLEDYVELPPVDNLIKMSLNLTIERASISDITSGGDFEISGTVVQIFKGNFLFDVCPMCGSKVENSRCVEHGDVVPNHALVLSFVLDDGTGDLRCVLFRDTAEKIVGIKSNELYELNYDERFKLINKKVLGRDLILTGKVKKNKLFDRLELVVNDFKPINPLEESKRLAVDIESMVGALVG